jgi:hypothetical protein
LLDCNVREERGDKEAERKTSHKPRSRAFNAETQRALRKDGERAVRLV